MNVRHPSGKGGESRIRERQGFCLGERILWSWKSALICEEACCPNCGRPLITKPGPKAIGAHRVENGMPTRRQGIQQEAKAS